ncbi:MAG: DCC1-like thiol-disulfide oxidoreductase family protein [Hyphomicrobium sp.]|nr:DCC1-like thiol-disulfide oxidoreductase family protein [Hyphomicrobium sp.]
MTVMAVQLERRTRYSYRADADVPTFDDSRPIVIFDGHCVLCSAGVQWMLARDPGGVTRFAAIQTAVPRALYRHYGLDADVFDTFMVLEGGRPHLRWAGVLAAARSLPQPWRFLGHAGRLVPGFVGDRLYDVLQRNRIRWFGARETCLVPQDDNRDRFLASGQAAGTRPSTDV